MKFVFMKHFKIKKIICDAYLKSGLGSSNFKNAGIWPLIANNIPESKLIACNKALFTSANATLGIHKNVALCNGCVPEYNA